MAYKFQLGAYTASGSLVQEGAVEVDALTADSMNLQSGGITNAGSVAGATSIDGTGDLTMGTITMTGFSVDADGDTALKSLAVDDSSTIGCDSDTDLLTLSDGLVVVAGELQATTLDIGGTNISATAAEINYLDNDDLVAADITKLAALTATAAEINYLDNDDLTAADITKLAALTATAAEINLLDDVTRGSIIHGNSSGASALLAKGSAHEFLQSDGTDISYVAMSGDATLNAGAITLAAAQTNVTSIINSSIGKIGTAANQEYIDFGTSNEIKFAVNNSLVATVEAGKFVVAGDLQVNGTTTSIDSTTINISSSFTFEGPADAHETILTCGSPTADATLELFQGNAGTYYMPAFSDSNIKTTVIAATAAEINTVCDGGNSRGTTALADGDGFIHNDGGTMKQTNVLKMFEYTVAKFSGDATVADTGALTIAANAVEGSMLNDNIVSGLTDIGAAIVDTDEMIVSDNGTIRRTDMSRLKTFIGNGTNAIASGSNGATLAKGVNYFGAHGGAIAASLPSDLSVGESVMIKAGSDCSVSNKLTVNVYANHTVDGVSSIILESPFAAVECIYVVSGSWRVF